MDCEQEGEMTASRRRPCPRSPATSPLDGDDILREILVRLPPKPSSLPRASAVCKRWRRIVADAGFFRRFRLRHRCSPPLLGFFEGSALTFVPTLESLNRVRPKCFSPPPGVVGECFLCLGCRHGLVLIHLRESHQVLVWEPVTGEQHRLAIPWGVATYALVNGAVLRTARDDQHFQVVLLATADGNNKHRQVLAYVYSSQTGLWGDLISIPLPYKANGYPTFINWYAPVLVGDSLYWVLEGNNVDRILELDLVKQNLAVIRVPVDMCGEDSYFTVMRAEGGGLGVLLVSKSDFIAQLWKRKTDCGGVASWGLARTIELDKLLSLKLEEKGSLPLYRLYVPWIAEENNMVFLWTYAGLFLVHFESLEFTKIFDRMPSVFSQYHTFESVYTAEICDGSGHDGAELLRKT